MSIASCRAAAAFSSDKKAFLTSDCPPRVPARVVSDAPRHARPVLNRHVEHCRKDSTMDTAIAMPDLSKEAEPTGVCSQDEPDRMDAYWRTANYLSVGQIYLYDNPLLREPLTKGAAGEPSCVTEISHGAGCPYAGCTGPFGNYPGDCRSADWPDRRFVLCPRPLRGQARWCDISKWAASRTSG